MRLVLADYMKVSDWTGGAEKRGSLTGRFKGRSRRGDSGVASGRGSRGGWRGVLGVGALDSHPVAECSFAFDYEALDRASVRELCAIWLGESQFQQLNSPAALADSVFARWSFTHLTVFSPLIAH